MNIVNSWRTVTSNKPSIYPVNKLNILLCSSHGTVYAVNKANGAPIWSTRFPLSALDSVISLFVTDSDKVIAASKGMTVCMELYSGSILWKNCMSGFGYEQMSLVGISTQISLPSIGNNSSISHGTSSQSSIIFAASRGNVIAIDCDNGQQIWGFNCPGSRLGLPNLIVEKAYPGSPHSEGVLYIASDGWLYCLTTDTGRLVWSKKVSAGGMGKTLMALATPMSSAIAARTNTSFNQNPPRRW
ncbi:quinon protein alcohol dehydrogenase-like superfamily [Pilobolus umbonatus]|nr:quinon protein alcohol dehydrogenase-like superfamily [Pilobolus umbonatus]